MTLKANWLTWLLTSNLKKYQWNRRWRTFGKPSRSKIIQGPLEDCRYQRPFKVLRKIFEIKFHSEMIERSSRSKVIQGPPDVLHDRFFMFVQIKDISRTFWGFWYQRTFEDLRKLLKSKIFLDFRKIFKIKFHSEMIERSSRSKVSGKSQSLEESSRKMDDPPMVFGTSSRSKVTRGCSKVLRDQRSFRDPRKIFANKDHSRTFGRASSSKVVQGPLEDLRDGSPFKDLCKVVEIKDYSRVFGSSSISKGIQGSSEDLWDQRSFKDLRNIFDIKYHLRIFW